MNVLVIDIGGTNVKIRTSGRKSGQFASGPQMTPRKMVACINKLARDWTYDAVSIGYPGPVKRGRIVSDPHNLGKGWVGFDFETALKRPVKLVNDAAMQAFGSYKGGKMLFLGLGTGLGSCMVVDGIIVPMELAHLPYKKGTYEDCLGIRGLKALGKKKWRKKVAEIVGILATALEAEDIVLGGGNIHKLKTLPQGCRPGDNANAFAGGFRLWENLSPGPPDRPTKTIRRGEKRTASKSEKTTKKPKASAGRPKIIARDFQPETTNRSKDLGYDRGLYVLPFDHRGSFETKMFGWHGPLSAEQTGEIAAAKRVIYDGFKAAIVAGLSREKAGILVDEQFGADILRDARDRYTTACPAEKSGQDEFDFEYGEDFASHIEKFDPTFCKVLVRYNPEGDRGLNRRQTERLKRLSDYLRAAGRSRFMFELLVPPEKVQLERLNGDLASYDLELRPTLMVQAIRDLQHAGVEPDVWKIEGLDRRENCERVVAAARRDGRDKVSCIVLGRGEDDNKVRNWLKVAATVPGFIGFAVGRTVFWQPLVDLRAGKITRAAAVAAIAERYRQFAITFESTGLPKIAGKRRMATQAA